MTSGIQNPNNPTIPPNTSFSSVPDDTEEAVEDLDDILSKNLYPEVAESVSSDEIAEPAGIMGWARDFFVLNAIKGYVRATNLIGGDKKSEAEELEKLRANLGDSWYRLAENLTELIKECIPQETVRKSVAILDPVINIKLRMLRSGTAVEDLLNTCSAPQLCHFGLSTLNEFIEEDKRVREVYRDKEFSSEDEEVRFLLSKYRGNRLHDALVNRLHSEEPLNEQFRKIFEDFADSTFVPVILQVILASGVETGLPMGADKYVKDLLKEQIRLYTWMAFEERMYMILSLLGDDVLDLKPEGFRVGEKKATLQQGKELLQLLLKEAPTKQMKRLVDARNLKLVNESELKEKREECSRRLKELVTEMISKGVKGRIGNFFQPVTNAARASSEAVQGISYYLPSILNDFFSTTADYGGRSLSWLSSWFGSTSIGSKVNDNLSIDKMSSDVAARVISKLESPNLFNLYLHLLEGATSQLTQSTRRRDQTDIVIPGEISPPSFHGSKEVLGKLAGHFFDEAMPGWLARTVRALEKVPRFFRSKSFTIEGSLGNSVVGWLEENMNKPLKRMAREDILPGVNEEIMMFTIEFRIKNAFKEVGFEHPNLMSIIEVLVEDHILDECKGKPRPYMRVYCRHLLTFSVPVMIRHILDHEAGDR